MVILKWMILIVGRRRDLSNNFLVHQRSVLCLSNQGGLSIFPSENWLIIIMGLYAHNSNIIKFID